MMMIDEISRFSALEYQNPPKVIKEITKESRILFFKMRSSPNHFAWEIDQEEDYTHYLN